MITSSSVQSLFTAAFIVRQIVSVPVLVHWSLPEFEAKLAFSSTKQNYFFIQVSLISSPFSLFPSITTTKTCLLFSITTSFLLFSLQHNHHHISIVFPSPPPPPPHFYCFPPITTTTIKLLVFISSFTTTTPGEYSANVNTGKFGPEVQLFVLLYTIFHENGTPFVHLLLTNGTPLTYLV